MYKDTSGKLYELINDNFVEVVETQNSNLIPILHKLKKDVKDERTGLSLYKDSYDRIYYKESASDKFYKWQISDGIYKNYYLFKGINNANGKVETYYLKGPVIVPNTIVYLNGIQINKPNTLDLVPFYSPVNASTVISKPVPVTEEIPTGNITVNHGIISFPKNKLILHAQGVLTGFDWNQPLTGTDGEMDISVGGDLVLNMVPSA